MEREILEAIRNQLDRKCESLTEALEVFSRKEIFDAWLCDIGICGYTDDILEVLCELGEKISEGIIEGVEWAFGDET